MTYIEQAIKKAIEGGYKAPCCNRDIKLAEHLTENLNMVFLDPLFWQCLGKAMGWDGSGECNCDMREGIHHDQCPANDFKNWLYHWHRFIDHLAEGKDAESFFKELFEKK